MPLVVAIPPGYSAEDVEQQGLGAAVRRTDSDHRSPFQHDVDRIMYAPEFRALSGRTQVTAADQFEVYHNRLTHSLKVAQLGRRMSALLTDRAHDEGLTGAGPDPDLVEAACLLHDIGHPPFGHVGERQIQSTLDDLASSETPGSRYPDGFQANAQNLRVANYMAVRRDRSARGLNLSRAVLDAAVKYPWKRGGAATPWAAGKWGCYSDQELALLWILREAQIPNPPASSTDAPVRPVEEQIMDWADEVSYACHDVEDFYRAGLIPLEKLLSESAVDQPSIRRGSLGPELNRFVEYLERQGKTADEWDAAIEGIHQVQNVVSGPVNRRYDGTQATRGKAASVTSQLISEFVGPDAIRLQIAGDGNDLTRYGARLAITARHRNMVTALSQLLSCYVIDRPGLASQQAGQAHIIDQLIRWYSSDPSRLLPEGRREEYEGHDGRRGHGDKYRAAADAVASLTEAQAVKLHRRLSGAEFGQVTDFA